MGLGFSEVAMAGSSEKSIFTYFPYIFGVIIAGVAVIIIFKPAGEEKQIHTKEVRISEAFSKMTDHKRDYERYKEESKKDSSKRDMADRSHGEYLKWKKIYEDKKADNPKEAKDLEAKWARDKEREKYVDEQVLPSDDPLERNKQLIEKKYQDLKQLDATCGSGSLNCPDIPAWSDSSKTESAGKFSHNQWVKILEKTESGGATMYKIQRRNDKKEGWVESKFIKDIYTQDKIDGLKLKDPNKKKDDPEDEKDDGKDGLD